MRPVESASMINLFRQLHRDQRGGASLETILIIAVIALPVLIFTIKVAWPRIKGYFNTGLDELEAAGKNAAN